MSAWVLGLDGPRDDRLLGHDPLEQDGRLGRAQGVAGADVLEAHRHHDAAGPGPLDPLAPVGVHREQAGQLLVAPGARVLDLVARAEHARVDAQVDVLAPLVHGHLEGQRAEGGAVLGRAGGLLLGAGHHALDRRHLERRRQVVAHGVEQRLDPLVAQGRPGQHRHDRAGHGPLAQRRLQRGRRDGLALDEGGGDGVVEVGRRLHQPLVGGGHRRRHRRGDGVDPGGLVLVAR